MYGAQTALDDTIMPKKFENDVEMYGAQTFNACYSLPYLFENDVEMYGAQTDAVFSWYAK